MESKRKIGRREFIKDVSLAGLGLAAGPALLDLAAQKSSAQADVSKLVTVTHPDAVTGTRVNAEIAQIMVDTGVMEFTGQATVTEAWASVLPDLSPDDLVTIKINCINRLLSTHPQVVDPIVAGLVAAGVKENNIIIWDMWDHELRGGGYNLNAGDTGVRCISAKQGGWGYDKQVTLSNRTVRLSSILTSTDHLINVPVLKDHGTSGVTLSMKNHYGSVDNPGSLHGGSCDPYIGELNNLPDIRDKTRLIVLDANLGSYRGGPGGPPQFTYNSIMVGQDPVALDYQGWTILEAARKEHINQSLPQPRHIKTAAGLGIGTNDPEKIELIEVVLEPEEEEPEEEKAVNPRGSYRTQWGRMKAKD